MFYIHNDTGKFTKYHFIIVQLFASVSLLFFLECPSGYYGYNCVNQCSEHCSISFNCDRVTGRCNGGCTSGWAGDTCDGK